MNYIFPNWPAPLNVKAFTTTQQSEFGPDSMMDDFPFQKKLSHIAWLTQVHGNHVVMADETTNNIEADSSICRQMNVACVVRTADCLPILLCDAKGSEVAAIHAGWKGLANGVIAKTLQAMQTNKQPLLAWFGPAISAAVYEVGEDVRSQFPDYLTYFKANAPGKWLMDLCGIARQQLQQKGIKQIYGGEFCTYTDSHQFFSARRESIKTGRMASLIWLTDER